MPQTFKSTLPFAILIGLILAFIPGRANPSELSSGGTIDIVFVIDISGSTGGILPSVRERFWELQNEIARLDPAPDYRIGIVCMGRPSFKKENDYVKVIADLTDDIDAAAYPFFQIKDVTAPGNYFMGHALGVAVNDLSWSEDPNAIKLLYLVGNGKPSAGPGYKKSVAAAKEKGIIIHSLYFLAYSNPKEQAEWKSIAEQTGGEFSIIGLTPPPIQVEKPYDGAMLREASKSINNTYAYYGKNGLDRWDIQAELDEEAELLGDEQVEARAFFKSTRLYQGKNHSWDLVDLGNTGKGSPMNVKRKLMSEELQNMSVNEFVQHLTEMGYQRKEYVSLLKMLSTQREQYIRDFREKTKNYRMNKTFYNVVSGSILDTAKRYGYMVNY